MSAVAGRKALGRGLSALIPDAIPATVRKEQRGLKTLGIEDLIASKEQPRKVFNETALRELATSIQTRGILQPILVRKSGRDYEIIAGERRWRAAQIAGLQEVPVLIKDLSDLESLEAALVENIQREDLNPIEEARAYEGLLSEHKYSQERLAKRVGKDRSTVANSLRLLKLPNEVQTWVLESKLSMGHARSLLGLPEQDIIPTAKKVIQEKLSVRAVERLVKTAVSSKKQAKLKEPSANHKALESSLSQSLGTKVHLKTKGNGKRGTILIQFSSLDELDRLIERFKERNK